MRVLYLEPFDGGSHHAFGEVLKKAVGGEWTSLTLPGRHWKWRMRGSALQFATLLRGRGAHEFDLVWASSYVALAELRGLVPWIAELPTVLYFHENQLAYPSRPGDAPDHQYAFTQMVSATAADRVVFNSAFNRDTFLEQGHELWCRFPDATDFPWRTNVEARTEVLGVPLELPDPQAYGAAAPETAAQRRTPDARGPLIVWNHRWEHDKDPQAFFDALLSLQSRGVPFRVAVCGQPHRQVPECFAAARAQLEPRIVQFGRVEDRADYLRLLARSDVAVSTARHEFFGIAMMEAAHFGACPLVPDALAYRELFGEPFRYTSGELESRLERLCREYASGQSLRGRAVDAAKPYLLEEIGPRYRDLCRRVRAARAQPERP